MKSLKACDDKPIVPCPFCGAAGLVYSRGDKLLLEMPHDKACPVHFQHHAHYNIITEDEITIWNTRKYGGVK